MSSSIGTEKKRHVGRVASAETPRTAECNSTRCAGFFSRKSFCSFSAMCLWTASDHHLRAAFLNQEGARTGSCVSIWTTTKLWICNVQPVKYKNQFHQNATFIKNQSQTSKTNFNKNQLNQNATFIKNHFHQKPFSSETNFIKNHFHQEPFSSRTIFIKNHFHQKPLSSFIENHFHRKTPNPKDLHPTDLTLNT